MTVSIMQPAYLPWLGYFDRLNQSDIHIVLDHVNLDSNSKTKFANRNKVRTPESWTWLTVPLKSKGKHGNLYLNEAEICDASPWRRKHWQTLKSCYSRSPFFLKHFHFLEQMYQLDWRLLIDLIDKSTSYLKSSLGITCHTIKSSEIGVVGDKSELILNLCKAVGAKKYISGPFGKEYLNHKPFEVAGIELSFHDYNHPEYKAALS